MKIIKISNSDLLDIWNTYLWPGRTNTELVSAITYGKLPYEYDISYMSEKCIGIGISVNSKLAGVNSVHRTGSSFRSRGLFVMPAFRGQKLGKLLLEESKKIACKNNAEFIWTMPRETSLKAYESAGFRKTSDWFGTETSPKNCFAICDLGK